MASSPLAGDADATGDGGRLAGGLALTVAAAAADGVAAAVGPPAVADLWEPLQAAADSKSAHHFIVRG